MTNVRENKPPHSTMSIPFGFRQFNINGMPEMPGMARQLRRPVSKDNSFYELLGVERSATQDDIAKAYRRKSMTAHPDKGGSKEGFQQLSHAYEILKDSEKRLLYDHLGPDFDKHPHVDELRQSLRHEDIVVQVQVPMAECIRGKSGLSVSFPRLGNGTRETFSHTFDLPPNTPNQFALTFDGLGHYGPDRTGSKLPGRLVILIIEEPLQDFKRAGTMLLYQPEKPVKFSDFLRGKPFEIPHPVAGIIHVCVDKWIPTKFIQVSVPNQSHPSSDSTLLCKFNLEFDLTPEQKSLACNALKLEEYNDPTIHYSDGSHVNDRKVRELIHTSQEAVQSAQFAQSEDGHGHGQSDIRMQQCQTQ